ncbi:hypothetical protein Pmi06nite_50820 [Planotetraspora mira]|uniref:Thiamine pyrophosphate enzyme TPP-binding domain-containing protein n=1 Tax=Planotetraspora mira TaxID=58121 RepID=A0A8J3X8E5_9ACTN|nr:hypothetical protein Pmi06nite_50820 [Planotetraspora mira]
MGDGSAIYGIQALWSEAHYRVGAIFVVPANGRYAVMDRLAEKNKRGRVPWPPFTEVSLSDMARSFGCPAVRLESYDDLVTALDEIVPSAVPARSRFSWMSRSFPTPSFPLRRIFHDINGHEDLGRIDLRR